MTKILLSLILAVGFCAPAFAAEEDAPTLDIITNVFATKVSVAEGTVRSVRVGVNESKPTIALNAPGAAPVLIQNVSGKLALTGSLASSVVSGVVAETPVTSYSAVAVSTQFAPTAGSFLVINGTGALSLTSTPPYLHHDRCRWSGDYVHGRRQRCYLHR